MPKIKNVSPFGDLHVPMLNKIVEAGSIIEVSDDEAESLLLQEDNWKAWGPEARKAKEHAEKDAEKEGDE